MAVPASQVSSYNDALADTTKTSFPLLTADGGIFAGSVVDHYLSSKDQYDYFIVDISGGTHDSASASIGSSGKLTINYSVSAGGSIFLEWSPATYTTLGSTGVPVLGFVKTLTGTGSFSISAVDWTSSVSGDKALAFRIWAATAFFDSRSYGYAINFLNETNTGTGGSGSGSGLEDYSASISRVTYPFGINSNLSAAYVGGTIEVDLTIFNKGTKAGAGGNIGYYISTDPVISTSDRLLVYGNLFDAIAPGGSFSYINQFVLPTDLGPGTYYFGVIPDYDNKKTESNESNNPSNAVAFTISGPAPSTTLPDFYATAEGLSSYLMRAGQTVYVNGRIGNSGPGAGVPGNIGYYISSDNKISASDRYLGQINISGALSSGSSGGYSTQVTIPSDIKSGNYYIGFIADYDTKIPESSESNNASAGILMTVNNRSAGQVNLVYRFFDKVTGDHFYTTSDLETGMIQLNDSARMNYEGAQWGAPNKSSNTQEVYRFYDTSKGDHFFTASAVERDIIVRSNGTYRYEGVAFEAYSTLGAAGAFYLERFYNTISGLHHFSVNEAENSFIRSGAAGAGWVDEGKGFIVTSF